MDKNSNNDFLFNRSFQKENYASLASYLMQGQKDSGIFTCLKHFPGYVGIPFNPEEELAYLDQVPDISHFHKLAVGRPEMIMVSNVVYKEIDQNLPFSFSQKGIEFLKREIPGDFLVISDDLAQNSLLEKFSLREIVSMPIEAGVNILIFSGWQNPVPQGFNTLVGMARQGEVDKEKIENSFNKILELKSCLVND